MAIRRLPPLLVNQIAAGEVIERPASVVKEAVENAIDAGASRIEIAIECGGKELIRISDNGCGIPMDELELALAPHATSKIAESADLDAIATMGFRGEALASITSVSRVTLLSRPAAQTGAAVLEAEGDVIHPQRPAGGAVGTTLTVRNLFFNTPARRKFLKTDQTETSRVREVVEALALAHPSIAFTLTSDGRKVLDLPAKNDRARRAVAIVGDELADELLEIEVEDRGVRMWAMLGTPSIARSTARHLRLFLNGRVIADRTITHAVREAYRGLIEPSRTPTALIFLSIDPALVDVNVHPAKAEVRFRNSSVVYSAVINAVRARLREADLTPQFDLGRAHGAHDRLALPPLHAHEFGAGGGAPASTGGADSGRSFVDYFRRLNPVQKSFVYSEVKQALAADGDVNLAEEIAAASGRGETTNGNGDHLMLPRIRQPMDVMQLHSSFLITQDESGLVIIDQHALHERVMFEKLKARMEQGDLQSQRLLMPAVVEVDQTQADALESLQPLLVRLGIEAEPMGPRSIAVHAFTGLLFERRVDPIDFMTDLLTRADERDLPTEPEAALHEVLDMMACKAAIKAGDRLSEQELAELVQHRDSIDRASNCPHGRPTTLRLSIRDLEKQFGRT